MGAKKGELMALPKIDLLRQYKRPRDWRGLINGFLLGLVLAATVVIWLALVYLPRPRSPAVTKVIPNPSAAQRARLPVVKQRETGRLTGTLKLPPAGGKPSEPIPQSPGPGAAAPGDSLPDTNPSGMEIDEPGATSGSGLPAGVYEVPMSGEIEARWTDAKTGRELGTGSYPVTGVSTVTVGDGALQVDTKFDGMVEIAVESRAAPPKWRIGAGIVSSGDWLAYVGRGWRLAEVGRFDASAWVYYARSPPGGLVICAVELSF